MRFERKHAVLLLAVAAWNVITFSNVAANLYSAYDSGEDRATGYWVAHTVLTAGSVENWTTRWIPGTWSG